jgi:formate dehydrogenase iron-sulfur subunit
MSVQKAILTDTTLCTGCDKCVEACKEEKGLGKDTAHRWKQRIDDLSSTRYTTMIQRPGKRFARKQCRHCLEPACVSVCLVGAMQKTPEGPVVYDTERCIGCRYCMMACPYGIPRYDWQATVPYVRKCDMCAERIGNGEQPACVEACPEKATIFGGRDELIEEAHRRIAAKPGVYQRRVFGEKEVGGTSVLYISDIPLDFLAWKPDLGDEPLPNLTMAALTKVPPLLLGVGGVMAGVFWITGRRMRLAIERESGSAEPAEKDETEE